MTSGTACPETQGGRSAPPLAPRSRTGVSWPPRPLPEKRFPPAPTFARLRGRGRGSPPPRERSVLPFCPGVSGVPSTLSGSAASGEEEVFGGPGAPSGFLRALQTAPGRVQVRGTASSRAPWGAKPRGCSRRGVGGGAVLPRPPPRPPGIAAAKTGRLPRRLVPRPLRHRGHGARELCAWGLVAGTRAPRRREGRARTGVGYSVCSPEPGEAWRARWHAPGRGRNSAPEPQRRANPRPGGTESPGLRRGPRRSSLLPAGRPAAARCQAKPGARRAARAGREGGGCGQGAGSAASTKDGEAPGPRGGGGSALTWDAAEAPQPAVIC